MHRRLAAWVCALTLAASAVALPSTAATVEAAAACTNWKSTYAPPTTIRVLRSYGAAAGKVQVVPFRAYVENVMAWEWPETYPTQALRARRRGGQAVRLVLRADVAGRQDGQRRVLRRQGHLGRPDLSPRDAQRRPAAAERRGGDLEPEHPAQARRKPGRFILTGYVPGSISTCGAEKNGYRLYQKGVKACAKAGMTSEQIARVYYGSTLELTDPGRHNIAGTLNGRGDTGAVVPTAEGIDVHVLASTGSAFTAPADPDAQTTSDAVTLGRVSADVDGDGDDELVSLVSDGPTSQHIEVRQPARPRVRPTGRRTRLGLGRRRASPSRARSTARRASGSWPATSTPTTTTT